MPYFRRTAAPITVMMATSTHGLPSMPIRANAIAVPPAAASTIIVSSFHLIFQSYL